MQKLLDLIKKYTERLSFIEETYMSNGVFLCDDDITNEELSIVEREYHVLKNTVESLKEILQELSNK